VAHERSFGLFDPTVQPLFALAARHASLGTLPGSGELDRTRALVGLDRVRWSQEAIRFARPGMALTFNGIAQGYATDRIARLLRRAGLANLMVDIGEIALSGHAPTQRGWPVVLPDGTSRVLSDIALASSAARGTLIDPARGVGHLFRPDGATPPDIARAATVFERSAAMADALSTAAALMSAAEARSLAASGVELVRVPAA
jgi:thiamine biosynthesis lipoprotein